jgi:hypothetical protein
VIVIAIENPAQPDVIALLQAADACYAALYPAESNHLLDIATLQQPGIAFFAAREGEGGDLFGCGAVAARTVMPRSSACIWLQRRAAARSVAASLKRWRCMLPGAA